MLWVSKRTEISKFVSCSPSCAYEMRMYICWGASFLSGIRHTEMGKGAELNQGSFVYGDAEFRVWRIGVGTAMGLLPFNRCLLEKPGTSNHEQPECRMVVPDGI
jgi:hypothetical protein